MMKKNIHFIILNDLTLAHGGLPNFNAMLYKPHPVGKKAVQQGLLKPVGYLNDDKEMEFAMIGNNYTSRECTWGLERYDCKEKVAS